MPVHSCAHTPIHELAILVMESISSNSLPVLIPLKFLSVRKSNKGVDLLASLCNIYNNSEDELRKTMDKANNLIADILKKQPCLASECETENLENFDRGLFPCVIYFMHQE